MKYINSLDYFCIQNNEKNLFIRAIDSQKKFKYKSKYDIYNNMIPMDEENHVNIYINNINNENNNINNEQSSIIGKKKNINDELDESFIGNENIKEGTKLKHRTNKKLECEKYEKYKNEKKIVVDKLMMSYKESLFKGIYVKKEGLIWIIKTIL